MVFTKRFAILIRDENTKEKNLYYQRAIEKFGGEVEFIYDYESFDNILERLKGIDGILLTGGDEVGRLDFYLIEYALKNNIKLFGICQGMQSMALYNTNNKLKDIGNYKHDSDNKYVHPVKLTSSRFLEIVEKNTIMVNSHHMQTVGDSHEFLVVGRSDDSLIEVVENSNHKFQIGVQWHPERMLEYDRVSNLLFKHFVML